MHEHDTELIMALADGSLDPQRAAALEAEIASCPTCAEDLALQRTALSFLSSTAPATMNDIERARLHRTVRNELGLAPEAAAASRPREARRYRLFAALAGAAAVLIAFVVIAPATNLLDIGGGDDDAGSDTIAFATESTVAADPAALPESQTNDLRALQDDGEATAGAEAAPTTAAPVTTIAAPATTAAPTSTAAPADGLLPYTLWSANELEALPDLAALAAELIETKSLDAVIGPQEDSFADRIIAAAGDPRCAATGAGTEPSADTAFVIGVAGIDDVEVLIVAYVTGDFDAVTVAAQDVETCKVLATSG